MKKEYYYGILPLALTSCLVSQTSAQERQINRPNVVFIYADDIGYGDLSCNGAKTIHTPNVERLAKMGVRFTNAHSAAATSTPSRYAMLTGEYAWRKEGTGIADGDAASIIRPERYTMADMFKEAGYSTGVVGKWHLGLGDKGGEQDWNKPLKPGTNDIGFDYSFIMAATGDRVPCVFVENDRVINLDPNDPIQVSYKKNFPGEPTGKDNPELLKMHPSHGHNQSIVNGISRIGYMKGGKSALWQDEDIADIITDKAKNFIASHQEEPFFLYMGTQDVHVPRIPHPRFAGKSGLGTRGDVILQLDWTIGEIMHTLDSLNIADNTILIFTSDNGPVIDDGYQDYAYENLNGHTPMGIYRGGKYSAYEAGTRIPFIIRWPAKIQPSKQQALFSQIDTYASLASLLNQPLRKGAAPDSQEHLDVLLGKNNTGREYVVQQNLNNTLAIVKGEWKYIEPSDGPAIEFWTKMELGNDKQPQLYDLSSDPSEKTNVAKSHPEIVKELSALLESVKEE
mgnify:CR=1 FL=1